MNYRFSGHETFTFRYAWLPKAYLAVKENSRVFSDLDQAMVKLGVGKNMVRSIRFWASVVGVIEPGPSNDLTVTSLGKQIFDPKSGFDPYLEDAQTLWLLHWLVSTTSQPVFSWYYLLNRWQDSDMRLSVLIKEVHRELGDDQKVSVKSLEALLKVFFHTYVPTRGTKSNIAEDNLDCPLVQLNLVEYDGVAEKPDGKNEPVYIFRRGSKSEIKDSLFEYCLTDFWNKRNEREKTLSFEQIARDPCSPGQIFKLSDEDIRDRLVRLDRTSKLYSFTDSSTSRFVERKFDDCEKATTQLLKGVYK